MKRKFLFPLLAALLVFSACSSLAKNGATAGAKDSSTPNSTDAAGTAAPVKLTAEEAHERMMSGEPVVVVDVRRADEYAQGHIPGAVLVPNEEIGENPPAQLPVMNAQLLVYCRSGKRSAAAAQKLVDMGYTNVSDFGGINSWPYETEAGAYELPQKEGTLASFTAYDVNGVLYDETIFAGSKLTMVNIWATFCGPCLSEMPALGKLAQEYAPKGLQVVGIVADVPQNKNGIYAKADVQTAQDLVAETGANYVHLLPSADLVAAKLGKVNAVPETIFMDANGNQVGESYVGARSAAEWQTIIDALLAEMA